jgi:hypothetical protein
MNKIFINPNEGTYPSEENLQLIEQWDLKCPYSLIMFIEPYFKHHGRIIIGRKYIHLYTCGWSGCEDIISSMKANWMIWLALFIRQDAGGYYKLRIYRDV